MKLNYFTSVLILIFFGFNSNLYANSCEEIEIGAMGKNHWSTSLTDGLRGELVNQISKNDDLYDKISPEIQVDLFSDLFEFSAQTARQVQNHLPIPQSGRVTENDLFSYKINDELLLELQAKVDGEFLFSEGTAGTQLLVSTDYYPGRDRSRCDIYKKILDGDTVIGQEVINTACEYRDKGTITRYYEKAATFLSSMVGKILSTVTDSEKRKKYAEDPLSGLKVHSRLGLPIDREIFYAHNGDLAIGDIIEHTTYFGVKPIGAQLPLVSGVSPRYYRYRRVFRTTAFKKLYGNKILVEIEDNVLKGNQAEIYRFRPKILKIIKLNFGYGRVSNFDKESLLQRFEIDLNKLEGRQFLDLLISSLYKPSVKLSFDSMLVDSSQYARAVKSHDPIYKEGNGVDKNFNLKFFKIIGGSWRDFTQSENIGVSNREFSDSEKYLQESFYNKIGLNLGLFEISKSDRNYECRLKLRRNHTTKVRENMAMFSECTYKNAYASNDVKDELAGFMNLSLNAEMNKKDLTALKNLDLTKKNKLNAFLKTSFNKDHIQKVVSATNDEIYSHLSELFFGEGVKNVFAQKYHGKWKRLKPKFGPKRSVTDRSKTMNVKYRECSSALDIAGIIDPQVESISESGIASNQSFDDKINRCYTYYIVARDIVSIFEELRAGVNHSTMYDDIVKVGFDLDRMGIIQALLVRLSGGIEQAQVRYTYIITSPMLDSVIGRTNGEEYTIGENGLDKELTAQKVADYYPRVDHVRFTLNTCDPSVIWGHFKLKFMIEDRSKVFATFDLRDFSTFTDEEVGIVQVPMSKVIRDIKGEYHAPLQFEEGIDLTESHNLFFSLQNSNSHRLSNEYKIYIQKYEAEEEEEEEEAL